MCFNSRAPRGARPWHNQSVILLSEFQFTCPSRSTTFGTHPHTAAISQFQFTCPSRSTTGPFPRARLAPYVSIHVPLAEHDMAPDSEACKQLVSIHVPLAEHDLLLTRIKFQPVVSIHVPLAEHDRAVPPASSLVRGFNSRAPRGARQLEIQPESPAAEFQFTCPSRSTTFSSAPGRGSYLFQFTCPSRSTTAPDPIRHRIHPFQFTCPSRSTTTLKDKNTSAC